MTWNANNQVGAANNGLLSILFTVVSVLLASMVLKMFRGLRAVGYIPGMRVPFSPFEPPGAIFPTSWWNPGISYAWTWRKNLYKKYGAETIAFVPFIWGKPTISTSNLEVARQILGGGYKAGYIKSVSATESLGLWGMNLFAAEGEVWRRHRHIMGPAFTNTLYKTVWSKTMATYHDMVSTECWTDMKRIDIQNVRDITFKTALFTIGKCCFGFNFNWDDPAVEADGSMSLQQALHVTTSSFLIVLTVPKWVQRLIPSLRPIYSANEHLMHLMHTRAEEKKAEIRGRHADEFLETKDADVFTTLVQANQLEDTKYQLNDDELVGNIFITLLAGHETTANALTATFAFLSLHPKYQDEIYEQINAIVGKERDPEFGDFSRLDKVIAVFFETLRLHPPAYCLNRSAKEDVVLKIPNPLGQEGTTLLPVTKGTEILVDMIAIHRNPRYFKNPESFDPSRWYGMVHDSEALPAFGVGPRSCIGRKFAITEAVCFLTMVLRDWRIEPLLMEGETREEWGRRVLNPVSALTLGLSCVPVSLIKRES